MEGSSFGSFCSCCAPSGCRCFLPHVCDLRRRRRPAGSELPHCAGSVDRLGGLFVLIVVREIGPLITAVMIAGAAGTAITADLGARKIREELDALQVLGVDPVKNLAVPRFLALMLATSLFISMRFRLASSAASWRARSRSTARAVLGDLLQQHVDHRPVGFDAEDSGIRGSDCDHLLLQRYYRLRRRGGGWARGQPGRRPFVYRVWVVQLRVYAVVAGDPPDPYDVPMNHGYTQKGSCPQRGHGFGREGETR